jgi:hypothetical protein
MIQANCRDRFTAEDFEFVTRTLATSPEGRVSLVELLTEEETRNSVLDLDRLAHAILSQNGQLAISPQLYFYVLTRRVLRSAGIDDRRLSDYIASLLEKFSCVRRLNSAGDNAGNGSTYLCDLLLALRTADSSRAFLLRTHAGNYALFLTGIFPESIERRSRRGAPDTSYYEEIGRTSFRLASQHRVARECQLAEIFQHLADEFRRVRLALNDLAERLINVDDDSAAGPGLALMV